MVGTQCARDGAVGVHGCRYGRSKGIKVSELDGINLAGIHSLHMCYR